MQWIIVGLGNPGEEYVGTRHNSGRSALEAFAKKEKLEWREDKKANALVAKGDATFVLPNTYMNKSGSAVVKFVKNAKAAEKLLVVYDDLDLPIGKIKISFNRSSGGHNGLKSIERAVKTQKFYRIRIGVSAANAKGVAKKPQGEEAILKFLMGKFKPSEQDELKKIFKIVVEVIGVVLSDGPARAMNQFN